MHLPTRAKARICHSKITSPSRAWKLWKLRPVQIHLHREHGCGGTWCTFDTSWIMDLSRVRAPATRISRPGATKTHSSILPQEASRSSESMAGASKRDPRRTEARNSGDPGEQGIRWPDRWVGTGGSFSCLDYADLMLETGNS